MRASGWIRTRMNLRVTHQGYAYQDLITGIALVDLMLGTAVGDHCRHQGIRQVTGSTT